jgi:two-component system NarL family sensor kinase
MEYPCNAPDRKRWFIGRVTPFQGDGPRRAVIAHEDITERKNAELEILSLSGHLLSIQEDERQRVARDLHDSVGQTVLAAKLNIEAYRKKRSDRERLSDSLAFLDRASQELRSIYTGLYPSILDDLGFEAAVRWYAKHILEANGISTSLGIALESEINHDTAVNLYRIIQEVLSNVLKHSGADSVKLEIHEKGGILMLTVQDKGIGFDEKAVGLDKFGLVSLRYRARLLGGECRIDSIIGEGTTVTVTVMRAAP